MAVHLSGSSIPSLFSVSLCGDPRMCLLRDRFFAGILSFLGMDCHSRARVSISSSQGISRGTALN